LQRDLVAEDEVRATYRPRAVKPIPADRIELDLHAVSPRGGSDFIA
jgi:hypothetical protein